MTGLAIDYRYRYLYDSRLEDGGLKLATFSEGPREHPYFFRGQLVRPRQTADQLRALMRVVQARYHLPAPMLQRTLMAADPVVTCGDDRLRFEGFSACCGVYVRLDLWPPAVRGQVLGRGTTNVDFNQPMLSALAGIRDSDRVDLSVGTSELALTSGSQTVVEKRVTLPVRWLKGFLEVQTCLSRMQPALEIPGTEAYRFLRSLPRMKTHRRETWIVPSGRGVRLSQCAARGAVRVGGMERLSALEGLVSEARLLRVHADPPTGASAWELVFDDSRFHLALSPEVWRGFSGEGQALESLASEEWKDALPKIRALLAWEAKIEPDELAARSGLDARAVRGALAALGSRGLVGFDLSEAAYFHREFPFDLTLVEKLQPRLLAARKLVEAGKARRGAQSAEQAEVMVDGSGVEHRVRLTPGDARCTCPWFARHGATRGPCKHILAARILIEESSTPAVRRGPSTAMENPRPA